MKKDRQIDILADQFESAWNSGQRVGADEFLAQFVGEETAQEELLNELRAVEQELQRKYPVQDTYFHGEANQRIGNYELLERIGCGGMGEVYRARHVLLNKTVAVKFLPDAFAEDELAVKRFERELRLIGSMSHPNIVQALGAEQIDEKFLLVMEFIEGMNLQQFVASGKKMSVNEALAVLRQVAAGLQHAHERKIIHRDIKPANIMLTADGTAKILDFGLGKFYDEMLLSERNDSGPLTKMGSPLGTVDFLSPEQWDNPGSVDIRSDIYSLGCTFYTIILGEVPYPTGRFGSICAKMAAHIGHSPPSLLAGGVAASPEIEAILQKMCAKDPSHRFATPQELLEAIDECQCTDVHEHREEQKRREQYKRLGEEIIKASTAEDWQMLAMQFREMDGYKNTAELAEKCDARYRKLKERREEQEQREQYKREVKNASTDDDWQKLTGQILTMHGNKTTDELAKEYQERFRILRERREK